MCTSSSSTNYIVSVPFIVYLLHDYSTCLHIMIVHNQYHMCVLLLSQESRSEITDKQPAVDAMLALGRSILAEPSTTSQNDVLMQKLTSFIEDWSELQMTWQNWYNELHANMEQSKGLAERLKNFGHNIGQLEPACAGIFPATVAMEALDSELKEIQVSLLLQYCLPKHTCVYVLIKVRCTTDSFDGLSSFLHSTADSAITSSVSSY